MSLGEVQRVNLLVVDVVESNGSTYPLQLNAVIVRSVMLPNVNIIAGNTLEGP
jgi:hypothetical protein